MADMVFIFTVSGSVQWKLHDLDLGIHRVTLGYLKYILLSTTDHCSQQ